MLETILHTGTPTENDPYYYQRWTELGVVTTDFNLKPTIVYGDWKTPWHEIDMSKTWLIVAPSTGTEYLDHMRIDKDCPKIISLKDSAVLPKVRGVSEWCLEMILRFARHKKLNISGSRVLLIGGEGRIGQHMEQVLMAMGARVFIHDKQLEVDLPDLIRSVDIISIHIPLPGNRRFYDEQLLHATRGKILINSSRREVVHNSVDLMSKEGVLSYATDFSDGEGFPDRIATPHIAGSKTHDRILTDEHLVDLVREECQAKESSLSRD